MKTILFFLVIGIAFLGSCKKGEGPIAELPNGIIRTITCPTLYTRIIELLPEWQNNKTRYPVLFSDTVSKEITITKETEVYVSFVDASAFYKNTLGWYAYNKDSVAQSSTDLKLNVIFPNVSGKLQGGLLTPGDMLQIGTKKFPVGTVIGFFLVVNGWENGSINYSNMIDYTNPAYNINKLQQHVLFEEMNCQDIVVGFEDMTADDQSDKDFNDVLITVSDNKSSFVSISFDLSRVPTL